MWKYIVKRLLLMIPILFGVSFLIFTIMYFSPGNPGEIMTGGTATQEVIDQINHELGYDQPFLTQYITYIKNAIFHFDFGTSWTSKLSVTSEIMSRFPNRYPGCIFHDLYCFGGYFRRNTFGSEAILHH